MSRTRTATPELTLQYATGNPDTEYTIMLREHDRMLRKRKRAEDNNNYDGLTPTNKKIKVEEEEDVDIEKFDDDDVVIDVDDLAEVKQEEVAVKVGEEGIKEVKQEEEKQTEEDNREVEEETYNSILVTLTYDEIEQVCRDSIACYYAWGDGPLPSEEPLEDIVRRFVINLRKKKT